MTHPFYPKADSMIFQLIETGTNTSGKIQAEMSDWLTLAFGKNKDYEHMRIIDRRLQALKKKKIIAFDLKQRVWTAHEEH